jgi:hypothetical protein
MDLDRRNDRWVPEESFRFDAKEISIQLKIYEEHQLELKKNENFLHNDEHEGMNARSV